MINLTITGRHIKFSANRYSTVCPETAYPRPIVHSSNEQLIPLLRPLINLVQERFEHLPLQHSWLAAISRFNLDLRDLLNHPHDPLISGLLINLVLLRHANLLKELLDTRLLSCVFLTVVLVKDFPLLWGRDSQSSIDAPRALVVDNVSTDLANLF